jgi:hypothetical protein
MASYGREEYRKWLNAVERASTSASDDEAASRQFICDLGIDETGSFLPPSPLAITDLTLAIESLAITHHH